MSDLLTVAEVAEWLRVSTAWVRDHAAGKFEPTLPAVKMGGLWRFRRDSIERFIEEREAA